MILQKKKMQVTTSASDGKMKNRQSKTKIAQSADESKKKKYQFNLMRLRAGIKACKFVIGNSMEISTDVELCDLKV